MGETHEGSPDPRVDHGSARFQKRRKAKTYKNLEGKLRYVVGRDIYMDRVEALSRRALIGRLEYVSMEKKTGLLGLLSTGNHFYPMFQLSACWFEVGSYLSS